MAPWELLDRAPIPGNGGELRLYRRGQEYSIRVGGGYTIWVGRKVQSD